MLVTNIYEPHIDCNSTLDSCSSFYPRPPEALFRSDTNILYILDTYIRYPKSSYRKSEFAMKKIVVGAKIKAYVS